MSVTGKRWILLQVAVAGVVAVIVVLVWHRGRGTAPAPAAAAMPEWTTYAAEVVGVRRVDDLSVVIEVSLPGGASNCARDLHTDMLQDREPDRPDTIYANVVFSSAGASVHGGCPQQVKAEVTMRVNDPVRDRVFMFNAMGPGWALDGDRYRKCDDILGCYPPADHCDPVWIDQAVFQLDVPVKHIRGVRDVRGCDGTWLVVDVNPAVGDCPPADGESPCTVPPRTTRWFMHFSGKTWDQLTGAKVGGCAPVRAVRPDFPGSLCENLPAVH
jgi:hypothetical protein